MRQLTTANKNPDSSYHKQPKCCLVEQNTCIIGCASIARFIDGVIEPDSRWPRIVKKTIKGNKNKRL